MPQPPMLLEHSVEVKVLNSLLDFDDEPILRFETIPRLKSLIELPKFIYTSYTMLKATNETEGKSNIRGVQGTA